MILGYYCPKNNLTSKMIYLNLLNFNIINRNFPKKLYS